MALLLRHEVRKRAQEFVSRFRLVGQRNGEPHVSAIQWKSFGFTFIAVRAFVIPVIDASAPDFVLPLVSCSY